MFFSVPECVRQTKTIGFYPTYGVKIESRSPAAKVSSPCVGDTFKSFRLCWNRFEHEPYACAADIVGRTTYMLKTISRESMGCFLWGL